MLPDNWLKPSPSTCRLVRLPNSDGILPDNWLKPSHRYCRLVRSLNSDGSVPDNRFSPSSKWVTRPFSSVVTPYHSFSGLSLSQLVLSVQLSPSVASYSATNTARSGLAAAQLTTPYLSRMPSNHVWKAASVGAHNCVSRISSHLRLVRLTNDWGSAPDNWLKPSPSTSNLVRLPNHPGSAPEILLLSRTNHLRPVKPDRGVMSEMLL